EGTRFEELKVLRGHLPRIELQPAVNDGDATDIVGTTDRRREVVLDLSSLIRRQFLVLVRGDQTSDRRTRLKRPVGVPLTLDTRRERPASLLKNRHTPEAIDRGTHDMDKPVTVEHLVLTVGQRNRVFPPVRV